VVHTWCATLSTENPAAATTSGTPPITGTTTNSGHEARPTLLNSNFYSRPATLGMACRTEGSRSSQSEGSDGIAQKRPTAGCASVGKQCGDSLAGLGLSFSHSFNQDPDSGDCAPTATDRHDCD
jgi:hypothetical protein